MSVDVSLRSEKRISVHCAPTTKTEFVVKFDLQKKKKVPTNYENSSTKPLIFYTCTNKVHMKICFFLQNSQYKITNVQNQKSENEYLTSKMFVY